MSFAKMNNIIFCGFPKSGKTSIGYALAKKRSLTFMDMDEEMMKYQCYKKGSLRQIYRELGEKAFRDLERQALLNLSDEKKSIISTGGGTVLDESNVSFLKNLGRIIYLKCDPHSLWERLKTDLPALFDGKSNPKRAFEQMYETRHSIYESCADQVIDLRDMTLSLSLLKVASHV